MQRTSGRQLTDDFLFVRVLLHSRRLRSGGPKEPDTGEGNVLVVFRNDLCGGHGHGGNARAFCEQRPFPQQREMGSSFLLRGLSPLDLLGVFLECVAKSSCF